MASGLSGTFLTSTLTRAPLQTNGVGVAQPTRVVQENGPVVATLQSSPGTRSADTSSTKQTQTDILVEDVIIGEPVGDSSAASDQRADNAVDASNRQAAEPTQPAPSPTVAQARATGILGCISTTAAARAGVVQRLKDEDGCSECDTIDCLADLLAGDLASIISPEIACQFVNTFNRSVKDQIDGTGSALMNAAQELTSANIANQTLGDVQRFLNAQDPGLLAQCFGANRLKDFVDAQLETAQNKIRAAELGKNLLIANKFNRGIEELQQLATTEVCN